MKLRNTLPLLTSFLCDTPAEPCWAVGYVTHQMCVCVGGGDGASRMSSQTQTLHLDNLMLVCCLLLRAGGREKKEKQSN